MPGMPENPVKDYMNLPDEEVFVASLRKPDLFEIIFDRYQVVFLRKAKEILNNEQDAYDAVQEAFVRIYSAARNYRKMEGISFKSWAYKVLMNQCFTVYQKKKKERSRVVIMEDEFLEFIPDKQEMETFDRKLTKDYVMTMVSQLPTLLRRVVTLHFFEERSQKEVAEMEGVTNEVVRTRIHRAKKELKKMNLHSII